ncbi:MAG: phosphoribosylformylglycinamidine synthase 2, phosphoribosylformylglycinamidine synthase [Candidatus Dadabacteria bacterium CSP1-2]|nr:MAG: phosphoribosylformylglycinamidine synthase 2, phosphoribosylformylglycinamidine synthase [Candidatus Dadabacteria bacterium CSP1-2]OGE24977.1 MAG: phosphoribosylformylglycinamidine synthase II [Candidatus Dadabacteria bacterium RBG_19FT_COMBO_40_33]
MDNLKLALNHGLKEEEYKKIVENLGREPNPTEIGIFAAMWSEHCSYKSSKVHLKKLPTKGERVIQGPGENAGIVDIGDGICVAFKMESHNHPSFIEPYQGAATGVGGILRDIFTMGARPIALLDSLRFGDPKLPKTKYLVEGVVSGIAGYGNCIGIPTVGGEVYFEECYNGNPLVNVFALGVTKKNEIFKGHASGIGNPVIYVGSKTGRDGIHGAVMASETFTREAEEKRPAVQVGDPFTEKLLLEACLELFKTGVVVGIQDMGAAGLTSSSVEMAGRGGTGITLNIDKVPRRETAMTPYEVMLSESQERMLLVVQKGKEEIAERIFRKWALDFAVIGEVTDSQRIKVMENGKTAVDLPIKPITKEAPLYRRPNKKPIYLRKVNKPRLSSLPIPNDMNAVLLKLISSPNLSNKRWICEQYDHMVRTNTIVAPGSDAAVIRVKGTDKALALTSNCNSRYCYLDPYVGSMIAVAESARNLACSGAKPLAITDCLNFGNPEKPEIMWQFKRSVEGMAEAARRLGTPVVSGNVSFYNETENKAIYPTPTVAMVGLIENLRKHITQWFKKEGDIIVLLGETKEELGGSEYLKLIHELVSGPPPYIDLEVEASLTNTLLEASEMGIINSAHDLSEGGLAVAIAESCFTPNGPVGVKINPFYGRIREDAFLFGESQSRVIVSLDRKNIRILENIASKFGVPMEVIGKVAGNSLNIGDLINIQISKAYEAWAFGFEDVLRQ